LAAFDPGDEPLDIELNVLVEILTVLGIRERAAMATCEINPELAHGRAHGAGRIAGAGTLERDAHELAHLMLQLEREPRHIGDARVVHQIKVARRVGREAIDRSQELLRVKLRRRRDRHDERALGAVQFAIRHAKGVAGENARELEINNRLVMQRMAGGVHEFELASGKIHTLKVARDEHALRRQRHNIAVQLPIGRRAVDGDGSGDQLCRIDQMRRAARVQHRARIRQCLHQSARAAGMIQMHVRQKDKIDCAAGDTELLERGEQIRHRVRRARVDKGGAAAMLDDVRGCHSRAPVLGIHRGNAGFV